MSHHRISQRRACRLVKQHRSNQYYRSVKDPRHDLRLRMREIAKVRVRYGYRRVHVLLRREGWQVAIEPTGCIEKRACSCVQSCCVAARWTC